MTRWPRDRSERQRPSGWWFTRGSVTLIAWASLAAACSPRNLPEERLEVLRPSALEPLGAPSPESLGRLEPLWAWPPGEGDGESCYEVASAGLPGPAPPTGSALLLREEKFVLECGPLARPSGPLVVEVELGGTNAGPLQLDWRSSSGEIEAETTGAPWPIRRGGQGSIYRFVLPPSPARAPGLGRLRLLAETRSGQGARLFGLRGFRVVVDPAQMVQAAARPWKLGSKTEWRTAFLGLPEHPLRWRLRPPAGARLFFDYTSGGVSQPVTFRVVATTPERGSKELFQVAVDGESEPWTWHQAAVDLSPLGAGEIELAFETEAELDTTWPLGLPAWGVPEIRGQGSPNPPNVVLVSLDTLRADHLSLYGYSRPTSPFLGRWAKSEAVTFDEVVAAAPWTQPAHVSLLTGREAFRHGVHQEGSSALYGGQDNLATRLRRAGYFTLGLTGGGWVHPRLGFAYGFDVYRVWPTDRSRHDELDAHLEQALGWLERLRERPFFLFFHTYEVHPPNRARQPWFGQFSGLPAEFELVGSPGATRPAIENGFLGEQTFLVSGPGAAPARPLPGDLADLPADLYDSAIAYTDQALSRLIAGLVARGLERNTLIVITSDHGEALGEEGRFSHSLLFDSNLRVPLVMRFPDRAWGGRRVREQVRSIDIAPTVLEALGLDLPAGADGVSLLPLVRGDGPGPPHEAWSYASSNNRGLALRRAGRLKYVLMDSIWPPANGREELYRLQDDPEESVNRASEAGENLLALRRQAAAALWAASPGLHLVLANDGARSVSGTLRHRGIEAVTVKSVDLDGACWQWAGKGKATFELPAGARVALWIQSQGEPAVEIAGSFSAPACAHEVGFAANFSLADLKRPQAIDFDPVACRVEAPRAGESTTGLTLLWAGSVTGGERNGVDAELRREIQALGYL